MLALTDKVDALATRIQDEKEAKRSGNRLLVLAIGLVLMVAIAAWWFNDQRLNDIEAVRAESRPALCGVLSAFAIGHNAKVLHDAEHDKGFIITLATGGGRREVRPEDQPIIDAEFAKIDAQVIEDTVPVPDCTSKAGIDELFTGKGK